MTRFLLVAKELVSVAACCKEVLLKKTCTKSKSHLINGREESLRSVLFMCFPTMHDAREKIKPRKDKFSSKHSVFLSPDDESRQKWLSGDNHWPSLGL